MNGVVVTSLDNISNDVLDKLAATYIGDPNYKVLDERKVTSFGEPREYFLISRVEKDTQTGVYTFIWIHNNLWRYRYLNTECGTVGGWVDPLLILNNLLK